MNKSYDLGKESIVKLIINLSIPSIISQLVNMLYNMVDRIFIGKTYTGDLSMAALGVCLPIISITGAFAQLMGTGGAPLCAIKMGQKNYDEAEKIMNNSFFMLIIESIVLTILVLLFREPLLYLFGANNETISDAKSYITIYSIGTIFVQITMGMNQYINNQGFPSIGMCTILIGAILNIILDPIFIFIFNMGVSGAALATILAQATSAIWVLKFLFSQKSTLKIRKNRLKPNLKVSLAIMSLGIAPFIMQSTESLVQTSFNTQLLKFGGNIAVGGITVIYSLNTLITLPISGLAQGAAPIISYNYGAKNFDRVKKTFKITFISCIIFSITMASVVMYFSRFFASIFVKEGPTLDFTANALKIFLLGMTIFGAQIACQNTFMALGQAKISLFMALLRKVILLVPLIYLLPIFIDNKVKAVIMAEPIADTLAAFTTTICFFIFYKKKFKN